MIILKQILKGIAYTLAILASLVIALFVYMSLDKEDSYWLANAQFKDDPSIDQLVSFQAKARSNHRGVGWEQTGRFLHRLRQGKGLIFVHHLFVDEMIMAIDDEYFETMTIWIDTTDFPISRTYNLNSDEVRVLFTRGGHAWPDSNWTSHVRNGTLEILKQGSKYLISINGRLEYLPLDACSWTSCDESPAFQRSIAFEPAPNRYLETRANY